jgi:hypothetical protein
MISLEGLKNPRTPSVRIAGLRAEIGGILLERNATVHNWQQDDSLLK